MVDIANVEFAMWLTAVITVLYQLAFFSIAATFKFDTVTDLAGGSNFVVIALVVFFAFAVPDPSARQIVNTALVCLWGVRLSGFLLYRVLATKSDDRFDGTRENFLQFLAFWVFQMLWVWIVSLPLTYLNSAGSHIHEELNEADYFGIVCAAIGWMVEASADQAKFNFKMDKKNSGKWCDVGVWKYSRHPNYFGELLFWWGMFIACTNSFRGSNNTAFYTLASPLFITTLLLGLSGMPILEKKSNSRYCDLSEAHIDDDNDDDVHPPDSRGEEKDKLSDEENVAQDAAVPAAAAAADAAAADAGAGAGAGAPTKAAGAAGVRKYGSTDGEERGISLEKLERRRLYLEYREQTSIIIPMPNLIYRNLPRPIKAIFFFEWPIYAQGLPQGESFAKIGGHPAEQPMPPSDGNDDNDLLDEKRERNQALLA